MTCFTVLGWQLPVHVYDLHTAYLAASNILLPHNPDEKRKKERKRLPDACRAYGIEGWALVSLHHGPIRFWGASWPPLPGRYGARLSKGGD